MSTGGSEADLLEYAKNPPNKGKLTDYTIEHHETNRSCGDSLTVFLKVNEVDNSIEDFSFEGDTAIVTTAAAAVFGESIIGTSTEDILKYTYEDVSRMLQVQVTPKRKLAASLALLATRNAIHKLKKDGIVDDFSDVLE